jgi:hypothetical protein
LLHGVSGDTLRVRKKQEICHTLQAHQIMFNIKELFYKYHKFNKAKYFNHILPLRVF